MTDEELANLFTPTPQAPIIRCECGRLVNTNLPSMCACGKALTYMSSRNKTLKLEDMDVGHLSNLARRFGELIEALGAADYEQTQRGKYEISLDLIYREIGSRDKEIAQLSGIMGALKKSLQHE